MNRGNLATLAIAIALAIPVTLLPTYGHAQDNDEQRAYQSGYHHGVEDREHNRTENVRTDDWRGEDLRAYEQGYEKGYRGGDRDRDRDSAYQGGGYANGGPEQQRAYHAGYQNGVKDRERNREMNVRTDDWRGENLEAYRRGYEDGYRGANSGHHDDDDRH